MDNDFAGLNARECSVNCDPERCVITGIGVCGHPNKGGLQGALMSKPDVVRRYQAARRVLERQKIDGPAAQPVAAEQAPKKPRAKRRKPARKAAPKPAPAPAPKPEPEAA